MVESTFLQTIILWTELFPKEEEREDPRRELQSIFKSSSNPRVFPVILQELQDFFELQCFTRNPATPRYSTYRINSSTRISKKYYNYKAHPVQITTRHLPATVPVSPSILHGRIRLPAPLQHSRATQHKQASSNSTRQKQHSKQQPASTQSLQKLPGAFLQNSTRRNRILSKRVKYCISNAILRSVCSNLLVTRILILSRVLVIPCEEITIYLQSKLS